MRSAESESESPGVVVTSQVSESKSESTKLPRLRLRIFYYILSQLRRGQKYFLGEIFGNIAIFYILSQHWRNCGR